jgi:poly[(R)-3-hydroxyalkanoate] polymerase subunit PhaC
MTLPAPRPDRRLAPRPLPVHVASAMLLWLSSRAALTSWPGASAHSKALGSPADERLGALAGDVARLGPERVAAALDRELRRRAATFLDGLDAYRRHPFRRTPPRVPVRWRQGAAQLLDYGRAAAPGKKGRAAVPTVLIVPSLINRYTILDLLRERSFARHLAGAGLRPLVLDWGEPGAAERDFTLGDYITGPLEAAADTAAALAGGPVAVCGYCMGGLLALALAQRRPAEVACLALLATPWDFHAGRRAQARLLGSLVEFLPLLGEGSEPLPVSVIQSLFATLDPFLAERKFIRFAGLDPQGAAAKSFVALEDWINDGVPLARRVALECAQSWYRDNDPARAAWRVAGHPVRPGEVTAPTLIVLPSRDRIVPPRSAEPLAAAIPDATVLRPPFGHIGMMASTGAPDAVWQPIAQWLKAQFA